MSLIKKNELKQMGETQIMQKLFDLKKELLKLNSQRAMGTTMENPGKIKQVKKTVARLYTRLTQIKTAVVVAPVKKAPEAKASSQKQPSGGKKKTNE